MRVGVSGGGCSAFFLGFLTRVNMDGSPDASFAPLDGYQLDGPVQALAVQPDGKIVLGGAFYTIKGTNRHGIARLDSNGSVDTSFASGAGIYGVSSLALQADGNIIVGIPYG